MTNSVNYKGGVTAVRKLIELFQFVAEYLTPNGAVTKSHHGFQTKSPLFKVKFTIINVTISLLTCAIL